MDLMQIGFFVGLAIVYCLAIPPKWREWVLLIASVLALYWLQPTLAIRWLDYSLPTLMLGISVLGWYITRPTNATIGLARGDNWTLGVVIALALGLASTRYIPLPDSLQLTSRPPELVGVVGAIGLALGLVAIVTRFATHRSRWLTVGFWGLVLIFLLVKTPPIATFIAGLLREQAGQDISLARATDLEWLGFSYVAFRLIATLRDRQTGLLPDVSLREYLTYVIFFPSITAGPIARLEAQNSFLQELRALPSLVGLDSARLTRGFTRIAIGLFKKFVVADSLALFALDNLNATQAVNTGGLWVMLYAYALRLFFDFSGYTDIAIGIGILFGLKLPENFDRPYTKHNITLFWQSWHMSLSNWVRFYVFSPLSRQLLRREPKPSNEVIMFICHLSTMLIIGAWHGVTANFIIWGAWHGLGLWVHKLWSDRTRKWYMGLKDKPNTKRAWTVAGWFLTFHFVVLGWVWFALGDFELAMRVFVGLFGVRV